MYDDQLTSASDTRQEYIRKMNSKLKTAGIIVLCALLITIPLLVTLGKKMKTQPSVIGDLREENDGPDSRHRDYSFNGRIQG